MVADSSGKPRMWQHGVGGWGGGRHGGVGWLWACPGRSTWLLPVSKSPGRAGETRARTDRQTDITSSSHRIFLSRGRCNFQTFQFCELVNSSFKSSQFGASKAVRHVKAFAGEPSHLSSRPGTHMVRENILLSCPLTSTSAVWHACVCMSVFAHTLINMHTHVQTNIVWSLT